MDNQRESTEISDNIAKAEQGVLKKRVKITESRSRSKSRPVTEKVKGGIK